MIPFGSEAVTLYHREAGKIARHVLRGCSWRAKQLRTMIDGAAVCENEIICRYEAGPRAAAGDLFVLGEAQEAPGSAIEFAAILEKHAGEAFVCESFADCTHSGVIPHYCAKGGA